MGTVFADITLKMVDPVRQELVGAHGDEELQIVY